jgi:hypothetical protein
VENEDGTHVVAITTAGRLRHTIRRPDGAWDRWGERDTPDGAELAGVACAAAGGDLHVCALTAAGRFNHTIRHADGAWDRWGEPDGPPDVRASALA